MKKSEEWGHVNNQQEHWNFSFDGVLHNAGQEAVYQETVYPLLPQVLDGYNGTVMCYGQTGGGKTFTMTGASENFKHRGLIPRALAHLYREVDQRPQTAITIRISYVEIYNDQMFDLLSTIDGNVDARTAQVHDDKGLIRRVANNEEEALNLLFEGDTNRAIAEHSLNKTSSRSHCTFTIHVESRSHVESSEKFTVSKLNLVDLAGSERLSKTHTEGKMMREAMYINKSLSFLEQVIIALSDKRREHIPYRQTLLTNILKDSLGGNCNTILVANIWGERPQIEETISTLRFATRMMRVTTTPVVNVQYDSMMLVKKYEREIKDLTQELAMHDSLSNRSHVTYEPFNEAQKMEVDKSVRKYLDGEIDDVEIINLRQIKEMFRGFRRAVRKVQTAQEESVRENRQRGSLSNGAAFETQETGQDHEDLNGDDNSARGVGDVEVGGFGIGVAPQGGKLISGPAKPKKRASRAAPQDKTSILPDGHSETRVLEAVDDDHGQQRGDLMNGHKDTAPVTEILERPEAFENFKLTAEGMEITAALSENKATLKNKRNILRELTQTVNDCKRDIDNLKDLVQRKQRERATHKANGEGHVTTGYAEGPHTDAEVIDEEEYCYLEQLRTLKDKYRQNYEELKSIKSDMAYCQQLSDKSRRSLVDGFEVWYMQKYGIHSGSGVQQTMIRGRNGVAPFTVDDTNGGDEYDGDAVERQRLQRIMKEDPEAYAFYSAKSTTEKRKKNPTWKKQQPANGVVRNRPPGHVTVM